MKLNLLNWQGVGLKGALSISFDLKILLKVRGNRTFYLFKQNSLPETKVCHSPDHKIQKNHKNKLSKVCVEQSFKII